MGNHQRRLDQITGPEDFTHAGRSNSARNGLGRRTEPSGEKGLVRGPRRPR